MEDYAILLVLPLIFLAWKFYFSIATSQEQKDFENDDIGEYFVQDIKKLINHLEKLPLENQKNVFENICGRYGKFCKETWKLETARGLKFKKIYERYIEEAASTRRENITSDGYKNPKWLAATICETLLFSIGNKMSRNNGKEVRKYLFIKMKKIIPNNHNLKLFIKVEGIDV